MSANKWVGGTLIGLGALTDAGALANGDNSNVPVSRTASLVVGTASLAGGLWLWNTKPGRTGGRRSGDNRRRRAGRYTGRAR